MRAHTGYAPSVQGDRGSGLRSRTSARNLRRDAPRFTTTIPGSKSSPDASAPTVSHHGQHTRPAGKSAKAELTTVGAGHSDVGDKDEAHTSEEELGVTTPRKEGGK